MYFSFISGKLIEKYQKCFVGGVSLELKEIMQDHQVSEGNSLMVFNIKSLSMSSTLVIFCVYSVINVLTKVFMLLKHQL